MHQIKCEFFLYAETKNIVSYLMMGQIRNNKNLRIQICSYGPQIIHKVFLLCYYVTKNRECVRTPKDHILI